MGKSYRMDSIQRRSVLRHAIPPTLAGLAGCLDGETGSNDRTETDERSTDPTATDERSTDPTATNERPFETPEPGECEQARRPEPTPTEEGLRPRAYPSYPQSLDADSAERFAEKYERAYQYNHFLAEEFVEGIDEITIGGGAGQVVEDGGEYFVGVAGRIDFADVTTPESTGTATPEPGLIGTSHFAAWYYLADRFALRNEVEADGMGFDEGDTPYLQGATVIVCN